jgi:hypothetical protein
MLLLAGFALLSVSASATDGNKNKEGLSAQVKYLGVQDGQLLFAVEYAKETPLPTKQTEIAIMANGQHEIFDSRYKAQQGRVLFKIAIDEIQQVSFIISSNGEKLRYSFSVNTSYQEAINVQAIQ